MPEITIEIKNPDDTYRQVTFDVDLLDLLDREYNLTSGKQIGEEYVACCPFHEDHNPSFSMRLSGENAGKWQCFDTDCGAAGNIVSFLMKMEHCSFGSALRMLQGDKQEESISGRKIKTTITALIEDLENFDQESFELKQEYFPLPSDLTRSGVEDYLTLSIEKGGRGYSCEEYEKLKTEDIRFCYNGYYKNRIIVPIRDINGKQIAFVARRLDKSSGMKYLYPRGWDKSQFISILPANDNLPPVICEGMFDGIHIQGIWQRTAIVIFGSNPSPAQIVLIASKYDSVLSAFDGDKAGQAGTSKLYNRLGKFGIDMDVLVLPEDYDPPMIKDYTELSIIRGMEFEKQWQHNQILKQSCQLGENLLSNLSIDMGLE